MKRILLALAIVALVSTPLLKAQIWPVKHLTEFKDSVVKKVKRTRKRASQRLSELRKRTWLRCLRKRQDPPQQVVTKAPVVTLPKDELKIEVQNLTAKVSGLEAYTKTTRQRQDVIVKSVPPFVGSQLQPLVNEINKLRARVSKIERGKVAVRLQVPAGGKPQVISKRWVE